MATTTNFGWTTPDDTSLVKDGAAAIRSLGSAIDTSLVDLKGGTTGQSLTKNSNTDMDFVWSTIASGGMTLLSTTTLSGTSTTITGISQSYTDLQIIMTDVEISTASALRFRPNASPMTISGSFGGAAAQLSNGSISNGSETLFPSYAINLYDYTTAKTHNVLSVGNRASTAMFGGGLTSSTAAITSIVITTDAGTPTFTTGTVKIYGVK